MNDSLENVATTIIDKLSEHGFIIHRYDAYSTNSIYLKLDYGTCFTIRIGDHQGKDYLSYTYNIGTHISEYTEIKHSCWRYFYPINEVDKLIHQILSDRELLKITYGEDTYVRFMNRNKESRKTKKGFWQQAKRVNYGE